jgi:transposase-like protein
MTEHLKARPHERTEDRQGYRNGSRIRTLTARVGPLTLIIPRARDRSFSTEIFRRYQRSEQAFVLALMEMYLVKSQTCCNFPR